MGFAHKVAKKLTNYPVVKKIVKDMYAVGGNLLSDKKTDLPGLVQVSGNGCAHNFGYYDKCPWSADQNYMIYLAPKRPTAGYVSTEPTDIILCDLRTHQERVVARTNVWNSQQGCMLQWLGPDHQSKILYNDFRDGRYCSVILSVADGTERVLQMPVYSVSEDGKTAITLDFSRLNTFGPGYGYGNVPDSSKETMAPDAPCMWRLDLEQDTVQALPFTYSGLSKWNALDGMEQGFHKINHIMLNPSATRFMFIHRWIVGGVKHHRLITCNTDGSDPYVLLDHGMVSHNNWKDDETIVSYCYCKEDGDAYHILHDRSQQRQTIGLGILTVDGHPSYSPDGQYIITDTYPDFKRKQTLYLIRVSDQKIKRLGSIYANIAYRNDVRCDLHPRWSRDGSMVCFDGAKDKLRQVYALPVDTNFEEGVR